MKKIDSGVLNFELADSNGKIVKLADFAGKYIVLYFYPKDNTPGCTAEACSFRDANQVMKDMGVEVIGVSKDSVESHQKFLEKFKLNFTLLSDPEKKLQEAFGVWQKKKFMGREYMGTARTTFILGPEGEIIKEYENVKVNGHAEEVLKELEKKIK
jgi:peroxiredoxin Q/BCP